MTEAVNSVVLLITEMGFAEQRPAARAFSESNAQLAP